MDSKSMRPVRGLRVTPKRTESEQRALNERMLQAIRDLRDELRRNGMTPVKAKKILRDLENERRARRHSR